MIVKLSGDNKHKVLASDSQSEDSNARKKGERKTFDERTIKFFINFRPYPIFRQSQRKEIAFHRFASFLRACRGEWILIRPNAIYSHCVFGFFQSRDAW